MDDFTITQYDEALDEDEYTIDLDTKTFYSKKDELVLEFSGCEGWTFTTGDYCTFYTDSDCTFNTGSDRHNKAPYNDCKGLLVS